MCYSRAVLVPRLDSTCERCLPGGLSCLPRVFRSCALPLVEAAHNHKHPARMDAVGLVSGVAPRHSCRCARHLPFDTHCIGRELPQPAAQEAACTIRDCALDHQCCTMDWRHGAQPRPAGVLRHQQQLHYPQGSKCPPRRCRCRPCFLQWLECPSACPQDIYSLGVLLWEMLAACRPWAGMNPLEVAITVCPLRWHEDVG